MALQRLVKKVRIWYSGAVALNFGIKLSIKQYIFEHYRKYDKWDFQIYRLLHFITIQLTEE